MSVSYGCTIHKNHQPRPWGSPDEHHLIPRAWQKAWAPTSAPFPKEVDGQALWDGRSVFVCPTGHRGIHYFLEQFTHTAKMMPGLTESGQNDKGMLAQIIPLIHPKGSPPRELQQAFQGMVNWISAGGTLYFLVQNHLWGVQ